VWVDSDAATSVINTNDFLLKADATATYTPLSGARSGFRNEIINGNFQINQRAYASGSNLASGSYGFDRWKSTFTNTTLTFTSAPQGQMVTINSGGSIEQVIERASIPAGTYILSWTGTATGRVYNTGATPPSYAASPITVTLDGLSNVEVEFTASGGTRTLQNVQLEAGSVPSAFEQRPIGTELALCQRYYYRFNPAASSSNTLGVGFADTTTASQHTHFFPVSMRIAPTALEQSGTAGNYAIRYAGPGVATCSSVPTFSDANITNATFNLFVASGLTAGQSVAGRAVNTNAWLAWSAEL
jgi:hypothetical protein